MTHTLWFVATSYALIGGSIAYVTRNAWELQRARDAVRGRVWPWWRLPALRLSVALCWWGIVLVLIAAHWRAILAVRAAPRPTPRTRRR
jgi:hypothetical protein